MFHPYLVLMRLNAQHRFFSLLRLAELTHGEIHHCRHASVAGETAKHLKRTVAGVCPRKTFAALLDQLAGLSILVGKCARTLASRPGATGGQTDY